MGGGREAYWALQVREFVAEAAGQTATAGRGQSSIFDIIARTVDAPIGARAALLQALLLPGYGLELIERVRRVTAGRVCLRLGSAYPALSRLAREGLVRTEVVPAPGTAGRPRKYYELTVRGVASARAEREALTRLLRASEERPACEPAERLLARLMRTADVSASLLDLRRRMRRGRRLG